MPRTKQIANKAAPPGAPRKTLGGVVRDGVLVGRKGIKLPKNPGFQTGGVKKKHRFRPGTVAAREAYRLQKLGGNVFPFAPFLQAIRLSAHQVKDGVKFTKDALHMMQYAIEGRMLRVLERAARLREHRKRKTICPKDVDLILELDGHVTTNDSV
jgi:histone H3